jgi:predicted nucleotidyltransferase
MADLLQHVAESGFPFPEQLIHLFVGGSELHGAKVHGTDDLDIYGVYIEPPELVLGLDSMPHFVWSTAGNERRNGPKDVDVTLYSLQKWAGLACKGNPTALHFLFTKSAVRSKTWRNILTHKDVFLSRSCVPQFLGFADAQLKRMTGQLGRGKKGQRPELEEKYGYDVKAGMHVLRLLYECQELITTGKIRFHGRSAICSFACALASTPWRRSWQWRKSSLPIVSRRRKAHPCRRRLTAPPYRSSWRNLIAQPGLPRTEPSYV